MEGHKLCRDCGVYKRLDEFLRDARRKDGRGSYCRECHYKRCQASRRKNPDGMRRAQRSWVAKKPVSLAESRRRYRARKAQADGGGFTEQEWMDLVSHFGGRCLGCGRGDRPLERDHVVPLSLGGADHIDNIQPLCRPCNASKGNRIIDYRVMVVG